MNNEELNSKFKNRWIIQEHKQLDGTVYETVYFYILEIKGHVEKICHDNDTWMYCYGNRYLADDLSRGFLPRYTQYVIDAIYLDEKYLKTESEVLERVAGDKKKSMDYLEFIGHSIRSTMCNKENI